MGATECQATFVMFPSFSRSCVHIQGACVHIRGSMRSHPRSYAFTSEHASFCALRLRKEAACGCGPLLVDLGGVDDDDCKYGGGGRDYDDDDCGDDWIRGDRPRFCFFADVACGVATDRAHGSIRRHVRCLSSISTELSCDVDHILTRFGQLSMHAPFRCLKAALSAVVAHKGRRAVLLRQSMCSWCDALSVACSEGQSH
eukprot:4816566-Pleurochrysis_carterae.AAC.1